MKRATVLGLLVLAGALPVVKAQPPAANTPKVIDAERVRDNLWVLRGGGGNTAVFLGADGVTVVDAKNPGWGKPVLDKIKELTPKPVTTLINTHTHGDHVSGNVEFPATVEVIAQENTKANMEKMKIFADNNNAGMAKKTFKDKMTLGAGADQIDLYYFGRGHTNGDAWVVFKALRIVHAGDIFAGKQVPLIDEANGGSMKEIPVIIGYKLDGVKVPRFDTLSDLDRMEPVVTMLPGWNTDISGCKSWDDLPKEAKAYVEFLEKELNHEIQFVSTGAEREKFVLKGEWL